MKKEKGITLIILTITVIIMLIILSIVVVSSNDSLKTVELQAFIADCEVIQSKVDVISEKTKLNENYLESIGIEANEVEWTNETIKEKLNIYDLTQDVVANINFQDGTVKITPQSNVTDIDYYWENGIIIK